ncbi:MAG: amidohydrolase [Deltaproteobacteria bacterium]|jgi:5-methylthioadenosine/S-adenosylhomocysteine deaminase|nr:amidohydrolase [Deltaproteobacteria bacterium]
MQVCDGIISADFIVTQNERREIVRDGAVAVRGARVAAIVSRVEAERDWAPAWRRSLGRAVILPGLINAHTHAPMTLLRGLADDLPLMEWLNKHIFPCESGLTPRMLEVGTALACAEMLSCGITAFADMYLNERQIYRTVDKIGMRALVGEGLFSFPSIGYADPAVAFDLAREQAGELAGHSRLRYAVCPHSIYTTGPEILEKSAALAAELDLPLHIHLAESGEETRMSLEMYGCRPVEVCRRAGILGPRTLAAHGVDLLEEEMELLAQNGVSIAHNPRSNMKLASGIAPVPALLALGCNVCLGTDGAAGNNRLNLFQEMSACALLHKVFSGDPTVLPAQTALDMATLHGARALSWPELGRLAPGGPADLAALDLASPGLTPLYNPVSQLVYAAGGHEVCLTMVEGRILYEQGRFSSLDYRELLLEARQLALLCAGNAA